MWTKSISGICDAYLAWVFFMIYMLWYFLQRVENEHDEDALVSSGSLLDGVEKDSKMDENDDLVSIL